MMTCSFHKYGGGFFPGTGDVLNVGRGAPTGLQLQATNPTSLLLVRVGTQAVV